MGLAVEVAGLVGERVARYSAGICHFLIFPVTSHYLEGLRNLIQAAIVNNELIMLVLSGIN